MGDLRDLGRSSCRKIQQHWEIWADQAEGKYNNIEQVELYCLLKMLVHGQGT